MFTPRRLQAITKLVLAAIFAIGFTSITAPESLATGTQQSECVVGTSACPAMSPQEIFNLYGTTTDGTYYIYDNGVSQQVYLKMSRTGTSGGSWVLMMKAPQGSTTFVYGSGYFTSNSNTTGTLANDFTSDAKYAVYNDLPITRALAVFANPQAGTLPSGGDISSNGFGGWTWMETITSQSMYSRLSNNQDILITSTPTTSLRTSLWNDGTNAIFSNQAGYGIYGFNRTTACNSKNYRWGIIWNNESAADSCDTYVGIGLIGSSAGDLPSWNGINVAYNQATSNGYNGGLGNFAFQLWGKMADPSLATPQSLVTNSATPGVLGISWSAPAATTPTEYVVQYKPTATSGWSTANTFRVTSPGATPSANISGLTGGTSYDVRVWARTSSDSSASPLTGSASTTSTTSVSLSLPGNATSTIFRNNVQITANVQAVGKVKFMEQGHPIPGCKAVISTASSATCSWRPSIRNYIYLQAVFTPNAGSGLNGSTSSKLFVQVARRTGNR